VPAVVKADVTIETVADPGAVPGATGLAANHEPPVVVAATAVNDSPLLPPTMIVCVAGAVPPSV